MDREFVPIRPPQHLPDLWLTHTSYGIPADAQDEVELRSLIPEKEAHSVPLNLFLFNRSEVTCEGGGIVRLWIPRIVLNPGRLSFHSDGWTDTHSSEGIEGSWVGLIHHNFDTVLYPKVGQPLPVVTLDKVIAGVYNFFYQIVTKGKTYPSTDGHRKLTVNFVIWDRGNAPRPIS